MFGWMYKWEVMSRWMDFDYLFGCCQLLVGKILWYFCEMFCGKKKKKTEKTTVVVFV
jgi:hypothetical protein